MYNYNELLQKIDLTYARIMEELSDEYIGVPRDEQTCTDIVEEAFQDFYKDVRAKESE